MFFYGSGRRRLIAWLSLGLIPGLWFALLSAQQKEQEPDAGELFKQGLVDISNFNTERIVYAKKQELAKFIPAGQEIKVTLCYRVLKPAPAEDFEMKVLDNVYPFPMKFLAEKGVVYRQEEITVRGTGTYVKQGAPAYPELSSNTQLGLIEWGQWKQSSEQWTTKHQTETSMRAAPETVMRQDPNAAPQLDAAWIEQNRRLLGLTVDELRRRPDAQLAGVAEVLRAIDSRVTGPFWSPSPGGILLSRAAAGKLGDGLTIDKVERGADRQVIS